MPYKDKEKQDRVTRGCVRAIRHGNWRQVYVDCDGMCQGILEDGSICGELETLEFHEPFGEDHNGEGRMQQRILYCWKCHANYHNGTLGNMKLNPRRFESLLQQDVAAEIEECGGYQNWLQKYELVDKGIIEARRQLVKQT